MWVRIGSTSNLNFAFFHVSVFSVQTAHDLLRQFSTCDLKNLWMFVETSTTCGMCRLCRYVHFKLWSQLYNLTDQVIFGRLILMHIHCHWKFFAGTTVQVFTVFSRSLELLSMWSSFFFCLLLGHKTRIFSPFNIKIANIISRLVRRKASHWNTLTFKH